MNTPRAHQVCSRCVSDTSMPAIRFDDQGVCQYCRIHDEMEKLYPPETAEESLASIVSTIKKATRRNGYNCVVGVSGGRDSTYTMYMAVKLGLSPLAVHFDNGWDSEIAVTNIRNSCRKLSVDLHTVVADWEEFKDLQKAFLKASVPEAEIPTDVAIHGALHQVAVKQGIKYILLGHSFRTEGICPKEWTYMDGRYINAIQKRFGTRKPKSVPNITFSRLLCYTLVRRIKVIPLLNYLVYRHKEVQDVLEREVAWTYYGGHHHESLYTRFFQSFLLPQKFGIDKRKLEYSALIRSGQRTREDALTEIREVPYQADVELAAYCIKKLGMTREEFDEILAAPAKCFHDYPSYYPMLYALRGLVRLAYRMGLCSPILYHKFFD